MAPGFPHGRLVHGVDEHVPIESLSFGARVLDTYVRADPNTGPAGVGHTDPNPQEETL
jgi:hypothetical protein